MKKKFLSLMLALSILYTFMPFIHVEAEEISLSTISYNYNKLKDFLTKKRRIRI